MADRTTADTQFEPVVYSVGIVDTQSADRFNCVVVAPTATAAIKNADELAAPRFKSNYAIISVEPLVPFGLTPADD